ncbi:long-chain-fatty-acid--CoA ligase [Bacillaceae bacterium S4-13-58]
MENRPWLTHYPEAIPKTIEYLEQPLQEFLKTTALEFPKKKALYFEGKEVTFEEVYKSSKQVASFLQSKGLEKGERVAIMLPNCPQSVISYYGVLLAGGVVVQTNPLYTERELEYQIRDSGAKFIVCLDLLFSRVENVMKKTDLSNAIVCSVKEYLPFPKNLLYPFVQKKQAGEAIKVEENEQIHVWGSVMNSSPNYEPVEINPKEDLAILQYTGGTTGNPKGVMLTHYNLVSNTQMCDAWLYKSERGKETTLAILPFFHVYGMTTVMNLSIMNGSKMVLLPKFEALQVLKMIEKTRPTLFPGAPTIYIALLNHPELSNYDLSSIQACISGSAPLPTEVQSRFEKVTGGRLVEGYGLTETSPVTHSNFLWDQRVNGSIGVPWPDTDAKIVQMDSQEEVEVGEVGELIVRGPQVMKGYWNRPEETEMVLQDGWLRTGDLGYMNEDGYFFIVDRKKDIIIAGGYNIYPREVEEVLYEHEQVQEVVIAGIPDPYRGETVKAYVVPKEGEILNEGELDAFCRERLAAYKVPKIYEFRDELPKTAVGKILRRALIDEEKEKLDQQMEKVEP